MYIILQIKVSVALQKVMLFNGLENPKDNEFNIKIGEMKNG